MVKTVRALVRGLTVLRTIEQTGAISLHMLSNETGLAKPTLMRILRTLEDLGYIHRRIGDQHYLPMGRRESDAPDQANGLLASIAAPALDKLCHDVSWPSDLAVCSGDSMRIQETTRRLSPFMMNRDVLSHRIHMLQSAVGRVYLAFCAKEERDNILSYLNLSDDPLDNEARQRVFVHEELSGVRARGYATRARGYFLTHATEARFSAIAVPVMYKNAAIAAVNITWVSRAATEERFAHEHLDRLESAAQEIGHAYDAQLKPS